MSIVHVICLKMIKYGAPVTPILAGEYFQTHPNKMPVPLIFVSQCLESESYKSLDQYSFSFGHLVTNTLVQKP